MALRHNPFSTNPWMPDEDFCKRDDDVRNIISLIDDNVNVAISGDRYIGKTSLIYHILHQKEVTDRYPILYVDLSYTEDQYDFLETLRNSLRGRLTSSFPDVVRDVADDAFFRTKEMSGRVARDILLRESGYAVEEILMAIDRCGDCLVVFDEFQQIEHYPTSMAPLLRSRIQTMTDARFIYVGSELPVFYRMFDSYDAPFHQGAYSYCLKPIPRDTYFEFCREGMAIRKKVLDRDAFDMAYDLFHGNMLEMQTVMYGASIRKNMNIVTESVLSVLKDIVDRNRVLYSYLLYKFKKGGERNIILCLGAEGAVTGIMSEEMAQKYELGPTSSILNRVKKLSSGCFPTIRRMGDIYMLWDDFFGLWIAEGQGVLEDRLAALKS